MPSKTQSEPRRPLGTTKSFARYALRQQAGELRVRPAAIKEFRSALDELATLLAIASTDVTRRRERGHVERDDVRAGQDSLLRAQDLLGDIGASLDEFRREIRRLDDAGLRARARQTG